MTRKSRNVTKGSRNIRDQIAYKSDDARNHRTSILVASYANLGDWIHKIRKQKTKKQNKKKIKIKHPQH